MRVIAFGETVRPRFSGGSRLRLSMVLLVYMTFPDRLGKLEHRADAVSVVILRQYNNKAINRSHQNNL